jgi:hypothetical protein
VPREARPVLVEPRAAVKDLVEPKGGSNLGALIPRVEGHDGQSVAGLECDTRVSKIEGDEGDVSVRVSIDVFAGKDAGTVAALLEGAAHLVRLDLDIAPEGLEALLHGVGELAVDFLPGAAGAVAAARVAVCLCAARLGGDLKDAEDFVAMGAHEAALAGVLGAQGQW